MQKHKTRFLDETFRGTQGDVQHCLRLNDLDEVGDGTHHLDFHMLGLFSFREWSLPQGIGFWMSFLRELGVPPDTVTIPPHRPEWRTLYEPYDVEVRLDPDCVWSDGSIGGDCTEFYRHGLELGNIVQPMGTCLDVGFGAERLQRQVDEMEGVPHSHLSGDDIVHRTIQVLIDSGVVPGPKQQGYVLRKLLRRWFRGGGQSSHPVVVREHEQWVRLRRQVDGLRRRGPLPSPDVLWSTYGLRPEDIEG